MASATASAVMVDRSRVCPFSLRLYVSTSHHKAESFAKAVPADATLVATSAFKDSTLRDLACVVFAAFEAAREPGARVSFSLVYPNSAGAPVIKPAGVVSPLREGGPDDAKTLGALKLEPGDVFDVAVLPPLGSQPVSQFAGAGHHRR